jgi:hypothetical protein
MPSYYIMVFLLKFSSGQIFVLKLQQYHVKQLLPSKADINTTNMCMRSSGAHEVSDLQKGKCNHLDVTGQLC